MLLIKFIKQLFIIILSAAAFTSAYAEKTSFINKPSGITVAEEINYQISFPRPYTHYCEVEINVQNSNNASLIFAMPVWTPGSYLVREFARQVEGIKAYSENGAELKAYKINKNSWQVESSGAASVTFKYSVYCNELTVRTSEVNEDHAYVNGANVFMFVRGMEDKPCVVNIEPYSKWKKISTGMPKTGENIYSAANYDILVDSPIEIGNQKILEFEAEGKKHYICLVGEGNYTEEKIINDFKKIVEVESAMFGRGLPYEDYTFIIHLVANGGGGLEHLNSFSAQVKRWDFIDEKLYKRFLTLIAHEFFHVWNVKRIRPESLGPFNYDSENYTKSLWVAEGWTSFYDNLITKRCGIFTIEDYYEFLEKDINIILPYRGRLTQSLEESSFDAWIKLYRRDENFENSQISYYNKGALTSLILNIEIINSSNGAHSLDDALRMLWEDYKADPSRGYTDERVKEICEQLAGKSLDEFWSKYISGVEDLPMNDYLNMAGLEIENKNEPGMVTLDIETRARGNNLEITKVYAGGSGYESGLNARDIIVSINGITVVKDSLSSVMKQFKKGDELKVIVNRDELTREIKVKLLEPLPKYRLKAMEAPDDRQKMIWSKWITGS